MDRTSYEDVFRSTFHCDEHVADRPCLALIRTDDSRILLKENNNKVLHCENVSLKSFKVHSFTVDAPCPSFGPQFLDAVLKFE